MHLKAAENRELREDELPLMLCYGSNEPYPPSNKYFSSICGIEIICAADNLLGLRHQVRLPVSSFVGLNDIDKNMKLI